MRQFSIGRPDIVPGVVTEMLPNGRYWFRRDHWPGTVTVDVTPPGAKIPTPMRLDAYCEGGSTQKMYVRWLGRGIVAVHGSAGPALFSSSWVCLHGNFARTRSWTSATFDLETADTRTGLHTGAGNRIAVRTEQWDDGFHGEHSTLSEFDVSSQTNTGFWNWKNITGLLDDQEVEYDTFTVLSLARVVGWLYLAVETSYEYYDDDLGETVWTRGLHVWRLNADHIWVGRPINHLEVDWYAYCGSQPILDSTDLIITEHQKPPGDPGPYGPTAYRVTILVHADEGDGIWAIILDGETGEQILDAEAEGQSWRIHSLEAGNFSDHERASGYRTRTFSVGDLIWAEVSGSVTCLQVSLTGIAVVWDSSSLGWHDPEHANYCGAVHILGPPIGETLLLTWSGVIETETVYDQLRSQSKDAFGAPYSSPRERRKAGLSSRAGQLAVVAATGKQIAKIERTEDGTTADGAVEGVRTDYLYEMDWVTFSEWPAYSTPRAYAYYHKPGVELKLAQEPGSAYYQNWLEFVDEDYVESATIAAHAINESRPIYENDGDFKATECIADLFQIVADAKDDSGNNLGQLTWTSIEGPLDPYFFGGSPSWLPITMWNGLGALLPPRLPFFSETSPESLDPRLLWDDYHADPEAWAGHYGGGPSLHPSQGGAGSYKHRQAFIWRVRGTNEGCLRTADPPHTVGAGCVTSTRLLVCGPHAPYQEWDTDLESYQWLPLVWRAYREDGTIAWTYTHPGTGGSVYCASGLPIAVGEEGYTYTFVQVGAGESADYLLIVLDGDGALVDALEAPSGMLEVMFDGSHFVREGGATTRFGPPL